MRRRHLLVLSAGALAAPALIAQSCPRRRRDARTERLSHPHLQRAAGFGLARRRLQRRRHGVVLRPARRHPEPARSARRRPEGRQSRPGCRAARRGHRARRCGLGDRRRPELDRPRRSQGPQGAALEAERRAVLRQPQHRCVFDKQGTLWFTGQGGVDRPLRAQDREDAGVGRAARPRPLRHYAHAAGRRLVRVAGRQPSRRDRPRERHVRASSSRRRRSRARAASGPTARDGCGSANGTAATSPCTIREDGSWKKWKLPGERPRCYSVYVDDRDAVWLTDFAANAIVRFDPETETFLSFPSDKSGANVRQMAGRPGEAWAGESGTNRLVVIDKPQA